MRFSQANAQRVRRAKRKAFRIALAVCLVSCTARSSVQAISPITALTLAPTRDAIVAGSQGRLEVQSWPSMAQIAAHELDIGQIHDLQFSPAGDRLLVVGGRPSERGEWRLVAWPSLSVVATNTDHDDVIYSATWLSGDRFVTGATDNQVIEWQVGGGEARGALGNAREVVRRPGHSRRVLSVEHCAQAGLLVTAGVDQSLRVWSCPGFGVPSRDQPFASVPSRPPAPLRVLDNHTGIVRDLATRPGDRAIPYVASASADKTVRLWQPSIGRLVRFARLDAEPLSIAWTSDGDRIAVGCTDGVLRMVDPDTVTVEQELDALEGWVYEVVAAPDGSFAVGGTGGQTRRVETRGTPEPRNQE